MAIEQQDASRPVSDLAAWVLKTYESWAKNRRNLEEKWTANRDSFRGLDEVAWTDPDADDRSDISDEGVTTTFRGKDDWHSQATIRITKQKTMTAFAIVMDAVLQGGRLPFMLKLSGELAVNAEDLPEGAGDEIDNTIGDMTQRIHGQFARCDAPRQLARAVLSAAIYGRAWAKFRPREFISRRMVPVDQPQALDPATGQPVQQPEQWAIQRVAEVSPAWQFVSTWDVFADMESEDVRYGAGIIHRQYVAPRELRAIAQTGEGWDAAAIARALRANPKSAPTPGDSTQDILPRLRDIDDRSHTLRLLECWLQCPRQFVERYSPDTPERDSGIETASDPGEGPLAEDSGDDIPCLVVLAGAEIVRLVRLQAGDPWPFYSVPWEEDIDEAETYGMADNLRQSQGILNAAIRCFEDNKRFSSSLILGLKRRLIDTPAWDGKVKPGMVLDVAEDARAISDAISAFIVPDVGNTLIPLIELFVAFADEESMVPKIQAGGKDAEQTAYEASIRVEKAGKYMGAVVRNFDDFLIAPVVRDFYEWNMLDPAVQTGKGPYDVQPLGFTSFQDRVVRLQAIQQFLGMVLGDPELRKLVKLDDALREIAKALDLDPDQWLKPVQALEAEAANDPQAVAAALAMEGQKAEIARTEAETLHHAAQAEEIGERLKIDRAKAVKELAAPVEPSMPQEPAAPNPTPP